MGSTFEDGRNVHLASGGELFERICSAGRSKENEALKHLAFVLFLLTLATLHVCTRLASYWADSFFLQQPTSGVRYCHAMVFETLLFVLFIYPIDCNCSFL